MDSFAEVKCCKTCNENRPLTEFSLHSTTKRPRGVCDSCRNKQKSEWGKTDSAIAHRRKYNQTDRHKELQKLHDRDRDKTKTNARSAVKKALKSGILVRQPCEECNDLHVHAHHDDYSKPLEVKWVCPRCHIRRHKRAQ